MGKAKIRREAAARRREAATQWGKSRGYTETLITDDGKVAVAVDPNYRRPTTRAWPIPSTKVPLDLQVAIADVVRSVDMLAAPGGNCFTRCAAGMYVMSSLGFKVEWNLGGMLYRVGPDPVLDTLSFCGPGNLGGITPQGLLGHHFLTLDGEIIDFSSGDWKHDTETVKEVMPRGLKDVGPIRWTEPHAPDFIWAPRENFAWDGRSHDPAPGQIWYTGFNGIAPIEMIKATAIDMLADTGMFTVLDAIIKTKELLQRAEPHTGLLWDGNGDC